MSPATYRSMLKPIHAELIASIRRRTSAKVFFHTDGDVFPLLDDLVEIGVDILNPIQTSAGKMADLAMLKGRYGDALVLLRRDRHAADPAARHARRGRVPRSGGSSASSRRAAATCSSSVHTIMNDVPAANVLAMVDAVEAYGTYPLAAR